MLEVAEMIEHKYKMIPERLGEAETTLADISKAKEFLNYEPSVRLKDWIKNNK